MTGSGLPITSDRISPKQAAGAVVTGETARLARSYGIDPAVHLANNDSYTFFSRLDEAGRGHAEPHLITTGPTATNVNDLLIILAYPN